MRDDADDQGREQDRADRQRQDAGEMPAEAPEGGEIGPVHQQRRQEQHQRQFGIER